MGIPISQLVSVTPGVLSAGGGIDQLTGLIVSDGSVIANGASKTYTTAASVLTDFGVSSNEYLIAAGYFGGIEYATQSPASLIIAGWDGTTDLTTTLNTIAGANRFAGFTLAEYSQTNMETCATWTGAQGTKYWFVAWDNTAAAITSGGAGSLGVWLQGQSLSGVTPLYIDTTITGALGAVGAALCWMASLDFTAVNGRSTLAARNSLVAAPSVSSGTIASILKANGYSYYGDFSGPSTDFELFEDGAVSGQFLWADSYINQIWLNENLQEDLMNLLARVGNIPFNTDGDALINAALQDTISQALSFGAIQTGVTLTSLQILEINNSAGKSIASTVQSQGYYLLPGASTASADVRTSRGPIKPQLWYVDGQSVQTISLSSVEVQ